MILSELMFYITKRHNKMKASRFLRVIKL